MNIIKNILWVDCGAAALAGMIVLLAAQWLSSLYHLPKSVIIFIGCVNLLYACYSFLLANYKKRSITLVNILVVANSIWILICLIVLWMFRWEMTIFALMHILGEAIFVCILARLEYLWRVQLSS
ncbi:MULTISPECIES: hypothetical protein [unclassified Acinetobacter]|uniref:hypothetical protein n=1 Tax=unclassified Acinetobacter TaxID=196816 RepID=UPI00244B0FCF|nr:MULTISPECIES: hypothetical protein [unclassified Acinetobacter]MDH0032836.1 hypothetical protein [Acinetobacter sp. GD04021]MDH0888286.1 hypothetical protein [Acinetobacter sp. GD03873]MDH1084671.1 hypothetical protein [Acinetobacter sp. GD03983]MDH2191607.1 hypothetical protein [Acinetobacter sp. GD03645]MDH2205174.1 hypothetical protein [Acinetobacter sp. GD03647]